MAINVAIGKAIIERLAPTGMGANQIIRFAREQGGGYTKTKMLEDIRVAGERFKNEHWVRELQGNQVVPQGLMVETDLTQDRNYRVYGRMSFYDEETDDYYEETRSFYTNDLADLDSWTEDYNETFSEQYAAQGIDITGFTITAVEHNKGYSY
jgi:hypothetical protein